MSFPFAIFDLVFASIRRMRKRIDNLPMPHVEIIDMRSQKTYGGANAPYERRIQKPVAGSVTVEVDATLQVLGTDYTLDETTGLINFQSSAVPLSGAVISVGFEFDVPVRFDTDHLAVNMATFQAGDVPSVPVVEVRI